MKELSTSIERKSSTTGDTNLKAQELSKQVFEMKPEATEAKNGQVTTMPAKEFLSQSGKDDEVKKQGQPSDKNSGDSGSPESAESKESEPKKPSKPALEYDSPSKPRGPNAPSTCEQGLGFRCAN